MKIVLGVVNEGNHIAGMSMLSFWTNFHAIKNEINNELPGIELKTRIVSKISSSDFVSFAKKIDPDLQIIKPSHWEETSFPPMANGSYATYWKFDLMNATQEDELLLYLDADAFIINKFRFKSLMSRIKNSKFDAEGCILMVPSHRPVYERLGYGFNSNPHQYFNAGMFLCLNLDMIKIEDLNNAFDTFFSSNPDELTWHDQDLMNSLFSHKVINLPIRYNVSTGLFHKENFGRSGINYLGENEISNAIVVHASGGILYKPLHYAFKENIWLLSKSILGEKYLNEYEREVLQEFSKTLHVSPFQKQLRYVLSYSPLQRTKLLRNLDSSYIGINLRKQVGSLLRKLKILHRRISRSR